MLHAHKNTLGLFSGQCECAKNLNSYLFIYKGQLIKNTKQKDILAVCNV